MDFNPRSSCEERREGEKLAGCINISIHAPHARSDARSRCRPAYEPISIHAPPARSDEAFMLFIWVYDDFNPRSSCEERPALSCSLSRLPISIHAPHARSDWGVSNTVNNLYEVFQSTLLMRGATWILGYYGYTKDISIHAPHARSDGTIFARLRPKSNFNPRSSCEERPGMPMTRSVMGRFQSTLLMRGATRLLSSSCSSYRISIHAPHARSDCRLPTSG